MLCPKCKTRNPIGFKFCHECGAAMASPVGELAAEEALKAETERRNQHAAALLAGALELREQRQYVEAIPLAEEASEILPDSVSAFALLASLYERTGDHDRAILAMERVVELNPESATDKVRLERMKQGVVLPEERRRDPIRSLLITIAIMFCVAALTFAVGYPLLSAALDSKLPAVNSGKNVEKVQQNNSPANPMEAANNPNYAPLPVDNRPDPFAPLVQQAYRPDPATPTAESPSVSRADRPERRQQAREQNPSGIVVSRRVPPAPIPAQNNDGNSGNAEPGGNVGAGGLPNFGNGDANNGENASGGNFGAGGRIRVGPPNGNSGNDSSAPPPQSNGDGYIHVEVKPPSATNNSGQNGGGSASPPAASINNADDSAARAGESPMARGRRLSRSGKYREAVSAYQSAGGAAAQQGIAAAQRALGDNAAARAAYREAARLYDAQGDSAGAQTCRAAVEALGG